MTIQTHLKQPFPKAENKWRNIFLISLFVTLFLFFFQPFNISNIENGNDKNLFIGGFGFVSLIILTFNLITIERLFPRFFRESNWCLYKELLWLFWIIFSIGLGNVLYTTQFSNTPLTLRHIANFQAITFAIALFPITIFTVSKQKYLTTKYTNSAKDANISLGTESTLTHPSQQITLHSYNEKTKEAFDINELHYIESKGNDIELNLYKEGLPNNKTLRNTLKRTSEQLSDSPELVQCHRAYIVNLNKITKVKGNSQGLVLELANCDIKVPVSRSFVGTIKKQLADKN